MFTAQGYFGKGRCEIVSLIIPAFLNPVMNGLAVLSTFLLPLLALLIAVIHIYWKKYSGWQAIGLVLMWQLGIGLGVGLIWAGIGHLLMPDRVAAGIGWQAGSPFQREVGMWDLALGIVGVLCLVIQDEGFWAAT